jgi:hypothetical protein
MMKLNPYSLLLMVGVLMFATATLTQLGAGGELVREGAKSVDQDISSFAARALGMRDNELSVAADSGPVAGELDNTQARVADVERIAAVDGQRVASR